MLSRTIFVVRFSNYYPAEIDSIWRTRREAQRRADELGDDGDDWIVEEQKLSSAPRRKGKRAHGA
jgi:hypothetical protein